MEGVSEPDPTLSPTPTQVVRRFFGAWQGMGENTAPLKVLWANAPRKAASTLPRIPQVEGQSGEPAVNTYMSTETHMYTHVLVPKVLEL